MKPRGTTLSRRATILVAAFVVTSIIASGQALTPGDKAKTSRASSAAQSDISRARHALFLLRPLDSEGLESSYRFITSTQRLRWFITSTIAPAHIAGVAFVSACGTALNRPGEYGPHWEGFALRFGMGMAASATNNALEAGVGLIVREDPRYFRLPQHTFKSRVGNVAKLTFLARGKTGRAAPAYARYLGIIGGNFLSNSWRVPSEANGQAALLRASEGFAGRMAANAFAEFWPDMRGRVFRRHNRALAARDSSSN